MRRPAPTSLKRFFPGREEVEDTDNNIWRRRGRLMNNKVDKEVWSVRGILIATSLTRMKLFPQAGKWYG